MALTKEQRRDRRNMNATAPARVAMCIWSEKYSQQSGGVMDFWDTLNKTEKQRCIAAAEIIRAAPMTE